MKYTHEELNKRCEKYFEELIEKGTDPDEIQDLCVIFLENGGRKYVPKWYSKKKALEEDFEKELVPFAEDNKDAVYYSEPLVCIDELYDNLYKSLITLSKREIRTLFYRFVEDLTLEQTGKEFGVTRERVRQTEAKALRKLRHPFRSRRLKGYIDLYNNGDFYSILIDRKSSISSEFHEIADVFNKAYEYDAEKEEKAIEEEKMKEQQRMLELVLEKECIFGKIKFSELSTEDIAKVWSKYTEFLLSHPGTIPVRKKKVVETPYSIEEDFQKKIKEIRDICKKHTLEPNKYSSVTTATVREMSNVYGHVLEAVVPALRKFKKDKVSIGIFSDLIDELKDISKGNVKRYNDAYSHIIERYPTKDDKIKKYELVPLFSLNFKWAAKNPEMLPKILNDKISSINSKFVDIIPRDTPFIDVLLEYDKYTKSNETKEAINKYKSITGNNSKCSSYNIRSIVEQYPEYIKSPFVFITDIDTIGGYSPYVVSKKSNSDEWKGELKKDTIKNMQRSRQKEVREKREKLKFEGITNGYKKNPRVRKLIIGKSILVRVKNDKFIKKDFATIIARAHKLIYANESSARMHHALGTLRDYFGTMLPYIMRYRKFVNENTEWVEYIIGNMIRNRIIDIENHKLYLNNPCNLIDKFMESRTINKTIECIVYKGIDNYDEFGCRYFMLDPHYVALLDIIYMLKVGAGYTVE